MIGRYDRIQAVDRHSEFPRVDLAFGEIQDLIRSTSPTHKSRVSTDPTANSWRVGGGPERERELRELEREQDSRGLGWCSS